MIRLGVVSFLNATPLIDGLAARSDVILTPDVPARLPARLEAGQVDAALVPIVDVLRGAGRYAVVSDACIGCDGETMTVRIFSQTPPDRITHVLADTDSHTSVALARVLFHELYGRELKIRPLDTRRHGNAHARTQNAEAGPSSKEAVLLIGDKVVDCGRAGYGYEIDLGGAWRAHTGLPFVFAVWAVRTGESRTSAGAASEGDERAARPLLADDGYLGEWLRRPADVDAGGTPVSQLAPSRSALVELLSAARDRGVVRAATIARELGPVHGWPVELAVRYLTRCLTYTLDARHIEGARLFARLCGQYGITSREDGAGQTAVGGTAVRSLDLTLAVRKEAPP